MRIREAKKEDKKLVDKFRNKEWYKFNKDRDYQWDEKKYSLIALEKKKILGFIRFKIVGGASYISNFIVSKEVRRKGVGNRLIKKAEEFSKKKGCHIIFLDTTNKHKEAMRFYKSNGYKKVATLKDNKFHSPLYFFEKRLK